MRYVILLIVALLAFGCVDVTEQPPAEPQQVEKVCRMVSEEVPALVEECDDVLYTEEVCGKRTLQYTMAELTPIHLCMLDGECGGKSLKECKSCQKALSRCTAVIVNLDERKDGTWTVSANFTLGSAVFQRDPVTMTIGPNESASFDFQHFYTPGTPINSATCLITLVDEAVVDDCQDVTRSRTECRNVTKTAIVQKEVCE